MSLFSPVRRRLLGGLLAGYALPALANTQKITVDVWKDPNCGCCQDWIDYLEGEGYAVRVFNQGNQAARQRLGLPERYGSCHTALVGGYVVEGHVPAADIRRLLKEKPKALGIAAPGMPVGAPGMDGPAYRGRRDAYEVLLVNRDGSSRVFASYR